MVELEDFDWEQTLFLGCAPRSAPPQLTAVPADNDEQFDACEEEPDKNELFDALDLNADGVIDR